MGAPLPPVGAASNADLLGLHDQKKTKKMERHNRQRSYLPTDFWGVAFRRHGSAVPHIMVRALLCALPSVIAALMVYLSDEMGSDFFFDVREVPSGLITPFALLVALLTSYRLNNAHGKWEAANRCSLTMHEQTRWIIGQLCSLFPPTDDNKERIGDFRRLLVLSGVVLLKYIRAETGPTALDREFEQGLISEKEFAMINMKTTVSMDDDKQDRFPSKNRPALIFFLLQRKVHELFDAHKTAMTPIRGALDADLRRLSATFEEVEFLNMTVLPLAYAQLTRLVCLAFLAILPFSAHVSLRGGVVLLSIASNVIYFTVDYCASEMEAPFGDDEMDVDLRKMLRRIDKHTASLLAMYTAEPVVNFNLYPEKRTTDVSGQAVRRRSLNLYQLEQIKQKELSEAKERRANMKRQASATLQKQINSVKMASRFSCGDRRSTSASGQCTPDEHDGAPALSPEPPPRSSRSRPQMGAASGDSESPPLSPRKDVSFGEAVELGDDAARIHPQDAQLAYLAEHEARASPVDGDAAR